MTVSEPIFIQIGRRRYQVADLAQASQMYSAARDHKMRGSGGASRTPDALIVTASGKPVARISYNGRVWPPEPWHPDQKPLYDNRAR